VKDWSTKKLSFSTNCANTQEDTRVVVGGEVKRVESSLSVVSAQKFKQILKKKWKNLNNIVFHFI